jgi:hypothetical protein
MAGVSFLDHRGPMMETVYVLHHVRKDDKYGDDAKLIGVYRSKASAKEAIKRLSG